MAIAYLGSRGTSTANPGGSSSQAVTTSGITAGNHIFLLAVWPNDVLLSVTDNQSNTWQVDGTVYVTNQVAVGLASCKVATAPTSVTATFAGVGWFPVAFRVVEFSGIAATSWKDTSGTDAQGFTSDGVLNVTASSGTSQADEVAIGVFGSNVNEAANFTPGSGWTTLGSLYTTSWGTLMPEYKVLTSTQTVTANATCSTTAQYIAGALGTYKGTAAAAALKPRITSQAVQRAATWCKRRKGILVPDLWLPNPVS